MVGCCRRCRSVSTASPTRAAAPPLPTASDTPTVVLAQPTGAGTNGRQVYWITGATDATNIPSEHRTAAGALLGSGVSGEVAWIAIR